MIGCLTVMLHKPPKKPKPDEVQTVSPSGLKPEQSEIKQNDSSDLKK